MTGLLTNKQKSPFEIILQFLRYTENSPPFYATRTCNTVFSKPATVPILSQMNPVHTLLFWPLLIFSLGKPYSCDRSLQVLRQTFCMHFSFPPLSILSHMLYVIGSGSKKGCIFLVGVITLTRVKCKTVWLAESKTLCGNIEAFLFHQLMHYIFV